MSDVIVFRSGYTPTCEPLRPPFALCREIDKLVARDALCPPFADGESPISATRVNTIGRTP
jgi:hypothetical protein